MMCGIFGVYGARKAAEIVYAGLHALQHRAQEFAGIATSDGENIYFEKGEGIVQDAFRAKDLNRLHGKNAIGHIRYSTVEDDPKSDRIQPIIVPFDGRQLALAHNGNISNYPALKKQLGPQVKLMTKIDTEVIARFFAHSPAKTIQERVLDAVRPVVGSYSLLFLFDDYLVAARDPWGNRPLSLGRKEGAWFVSSETVAFDNLGIEIVREIQPGEILVISQHGVSSSFMSSDRSRIIASQSRCPRAHCVFELIYFGHPASEMFGQGVLEYRQRAGCQLCRSCPVDTSAGDWVVVAIPDSANFHAEGFAEAAGIKSLSGLIRSHYIDRTFIAPNQALRDIKVRKKFTAVRRLVRGKNVILVDDSIVRLTTIPAIVNLLRQAGAKKIVGRIVAPMIKHSCVYGIDTPSQSELAAAKFSLDEITAKSGLDGLQFMSLADLRSLVHNPDDFCYACMDGNYPIK